MADQGFIYFVIGALVSYSRSIILKKVDRQSGQINQRKLIAAIIKDPEVAKAIKTYSPSKDESPWIPRAISWKFHKLLGWACNKRAMEILDLRRKSAVDPELN
jgi:hypothetical protein